MVDLFEDAAQRLARDQQKLRGRKTVAVSAKAKREADYRRRQQEKVRQERERQRAVAAHWEKYMTACDRGLGVKRLTTAVGADQLQLQPTSIHGEGDKIALPPSVLEFLTSSSQDDMAAASPWMFRIGILNPDYTFPQSVVLQTLKPDSDDHEDEMDDVSEDDDEDHHTSTKEAYLDELSYKYIAYTYGTVVEFTQEEGHVGLPLPIAAALMDPQRRSAAHSNFTLPSKRTQDPSGNNDNKEDEEHQNDDDMEDKTPGHVAYGAFDVPDMPVEITMVKLPKGKGCTLKPTLEAIQKGFYNLQNVKMVLEQSLIRTRATLSVGDTVQTWHRGVQYDLTVSKVLPATYHAVTCINTDIEVEFDQVTTEPEEQTNDDGMTHDQPQTTTTNSGQTLSGGRTLSSSPTPPTSTAQSTTATAMELKPEPPAEQKEGICTVQIRGDGVVASSSKRRFEVQTATLQDLFEFASHLSGMESSLFRLVTRFPRKVYDIQETGGTVMTLEEAGIAPGQELFMMERI